MGNGGGRGDLLRRLIDLTKQSAQLFERVVNRVGDGAGDVFGHRRQNGQVASETCCSSFISRKMAA